MTYQHWVSKVLHLSSNTSVPSTRTNLVVLVGEMRYLDLDQPHEYKPNTVCYETPTDEIMPEITAFPCPSPILGEYVYLGKRIISSFNVAEIQVFSVEALPDLSFAWADWTSWITDESSGLQMRERACESTHSQYGKTAVTTRRVVMAGRCETAFPGETATEQNA